MGANNTFNPVDYGGTNNTAVQAAVSAARSALGAVVLSPGVNYQITSMVDLNWTGASIGSAVPGAKAKLDYATAAGDAIQFAGSLEYQSVHDLILTSSVGSRTGSGIRQQAGHTIDKALIENVHVSNQYVGVRVDGTGLSRIHNLECISNISHGLMMYNTLAAPLQWNLTGRNLFGSNGGTGLLVQSGGYGQVSVGDIAGVSGFGNAAYGMAFIGASGNPIQAVRLRDFFIGGDSVDGLYMDTYGEQHSIENGQIEASGQRGFYATANNYFTKVTSVHSRDNQRMGFAYLGDDGQFVNCSAISNGRGAIAPYGFYMDGARNQIVGGRSGNQAGITSQTYGVIFATNANHQLVGHNSLGNATAGTSGTFSTGNV